MQCQIAVGSEQSLLVEESLSSRKVTVAKTVYKLEGLGCMPWPSALTDQARGWYNFGITTTHSLRAIAVCGVELCVAY